MDVDRGRPIHPRLTSNPSFHFTPFLLLVNQVVDVGRSILREDDMGDEIVFVMKGMVNPYTKGVSHISQCNTLLFTHLSRSPPPPPIFVVFLYSLSLLGVCDDRYGRDPARHSHRR